MLLARRPTLALPADLLQCMLTSLQPVRTIHASSRSRLSQKPYYVTTPIFYVNAEPHIGHLHSLVLADVLKRWRRLRHGEHEPEPVMLTGTDEHGMKIQKAAEKLNTTPLELCDRVSKRFMALADKANINYDVFYRTTNPEHVKVVQEVWRRLEGKDLIYKANYEGWYSVSDEAYYTSNQVQDQEGPNGTIKVATETGQPVEWTSEENYMFKLSQFREPLLQWLKAHPSVIRPDVRYNEVMSYLQSGEMNDLSISRPRSRLQWGIEVPGDSSHTIYVWMDALINYLSYTGYPKKHEHLWPADTHVIGKDIIRFHAVYWPAILMALDLPLPRQILAHAHWTVGDLKMSKSRGNVADPFKALDDLSTDGVRFFLMRQGGLSSDSKYVEDFVVRDHNKFLAGQAGNLLSRLQSKSMSNLMKAVSIAASEVVKSKNVEEQELHQYIQDLPGIFEDRMEASNVSGAIDAVTECLAKLNAYMTLKEPWKLKEQEQSREAAGVFSLLLEGLRKSSILLQPIIPESSQKLLNGLGYAEKPTWKAAQSDHTIDGMRNILDAVMRNGRGNHIFPALTRPEVTTDI